VRNVVVPSSTAKLDALGLVLLVPGVTALIYGLTEAGSASRSVGVAVASLVIGVVLSVVFVLHALRARSDSLLDLRLFGVPAFRVGTAANFLFSMAMFGVLIPLPLYFQLVRGSTVLESALALLPQSLGYLMAVMVLNRLSMVLGVRYLTLLGTLLVIAGSVPFALITAESNRILLAVALVVRGMGLGAAMMPTMTVAFASVDRERAPSATAAFNVSQRVGASLGTAVIAIVLQNRMSDRLPAGTSNFSRVEPGGGAAHTLAPAFDAPFWWAITFTALALVPAFLLPGRHEAPTPQRAEERALQPE
jgi:Na+/melibiose symporter-like transporter